MGQMRGVNGEGREAMGRGGGIRRLEQEGQEGE